MISARNHGGPSDDASISDMSRFGNTKYGMGTYMNRSPGGNITPTSQLTRNKLSDSSGSMDSHGKSQPLQQAKKISNFDRAKAGQVHEKNELSRRDLSARLEDDDYKEEATKKKATPREFNKNAHNAKQTSK